MGRRAIRGNGIAIWPVPTLAMVIVASSAIAACGVGSGLSPSPTPVDDTPVARAAATDDVFELRVSTPDARPAPNEPITVVTTVAYVGPEQSVTIAGAAGGPVGFELVDVDHGRSVGPVADDACTHDRMTRDVATTIPFVKSGAYADDVPADDLSRWYLSDPVLRLPAGRWRIVAHLTAYVGDCTLRGAHELSAAIELRVAP